MKGGDAASDQPAVKAQVETAVGVLMELRGWDEFSARAHLIVAADRADTPVEKVAPALSALYG
jgi:AmiR/NasT family two-component response regulator